MSQSQWPMHQVGEEVPPVVGVLVVDVVGADTVAEGNLELQQSSS